MRIEMGKKYKYRCGEEATILTVDRPHSTYPVLAMDKFGVLTCHSSSGENAYSQHNDLIEAKEERVKYINMYEDSGYDSREEADHHAGNDRLACVKVVYTEGQFDE